MFTFISYIYLLVYIQLIRGNNMIGKKIFGIFIVILFMFQITSVVLVSADKINPVIETSIYNDEPQYWGVSIIGFDEPHSVNATPFIYD